MKSLARLNPYFWKYRYRLILGLLFITAYSYFSNIPVSLMGEGIDYVLLAQKANYSGDRVMGMLLRYGLEIIGITLVYGFFLFLNRQTIIVMSRLIEYDLKNDIYAHYQKLDLAFYKRNNTGDLMNRISEDVNRVRMYLGPAIMYAFTTLISVVVTVFFMLERDPLMTLYVIAPLPVLTISIYYVSTLINRKSTKVQAKLSKLTTMAQESFSGIRVIKAFAREKKTQENWEAESENYKSLNMGLARTEALFMPFMMLLIGMSIILTIWIGGKETVAGRIGVGTIGEFVLYVMKLTWPIASLGWITSLVQRAAASQARINEFLDTQPTISNPTHEPLHLKGGIEFRDVSFVYPDSGIRALDHVSFTVQPGQSLALIGRTGSGKSSVASLITRMYDATEGQVLIDGKDIRRINLEELRAGTGYVPQEVFLFSDTIAGNIAFSATDLREIEKSRGAIEQAARDAAIYSSIMEFPQQFDTVVGERGVTLSGGQKQRISIARAIIKHPQLLIFDDCLSAVDTETEDEILGNLKRIMKDKTTLIISHRVSSVQHADQILVFDDGRVVEQGNHASLLEQNGIYASLYRKQALEKAGHIPGS